MLRCWAWTIGLLLFSSDAFAQAARDDRAAAETLFTEGRALMREGRYDEACPKLRASYVLDPALGALLNLAECYERAGKTASAWRTFHQAITEAQRQGRKDRETLAEKRANALEPNLSLLEITGTVPIGARVLRNGVEVPPSLIGAQLPVDPGSQTVEVSTASGSHWSTTVNVKAPGVVRVRLPASAGAPQPSPQAQQYMTPGAAPLVPDTAPPPPPPRETTASGPSSLRWVGVGSGAVGVVGIGIGSYFGLRAASLKSDSGCGATCTPEGAETLADARTSGNVATGAFIAGGVLLAAGLLLWLLGSQ
jgi:hypothetical protein